jgi:hypothetical protein
MRISALARARTEDHEARSTDMANGHRPFAAILADITSLDKAIARHNEDRRINQAGAGAPPSSQGRCTSGAQSCSRSWSSTAGKARTMAQPAKIVSLDRVRAGREALRGAFPMGPTRSRLLAALECGHDCVLFSADQLAEEFGTDRPIQHLLRALGGGWSAWRSDRHPGIWIFDRHIPAEKAWARITGQSA